MPFCPECGAEYPPAVVACPRCRVVLVAEREPAPGDDATAGEIVQRVPDAASAALLCGLLEHNGIPAVLRSTTLPGYPGVGRDWSTSTWGEILVPRSDAEEARGVIADYLAAIERGGVVRDEDVEESAPE